MKARNKRFARRMAVGVVLALAAAVGLQSCNRGAWHSPERMEKRFKWFEEEFSEELSIRAEQQAAFQALSDAYKALARERISQVKDSAVQANAELEKEDPDADVVVRLIKNHIRGRPSSEKLEALVDQSRDFYDSLDSSQQKTLRDMAGKNIRRHL